MRTGTTSPFKGWPPVWSLRHEIGVRIEAAYTSPAAVKFRRILYRWIFLPVFLVMLPLHTHNVARDDYVPPGLWPVIRINADHAYVMSHGLKYYLAFVLISPFWLFPLTKSKLTLKITPETCAWRHRFPAFQSYDMAQSHVIEQIHHRAEAEARNDPYNKKKQIYRRSYRAEFITRGQPVVIYQIYAGRSIAKKEKLFARIFALHVCMKEPWTMEAWDEFAEQTRMREYPLWMMRVLRRAGKAALFLCLLGTIPAMAYMGYHIDLQPSIAKLTANLPHVTVCVPPHLEKPNLSGADQAYRTRMFAHAQDIAQQAANPMGDGPAYKLAKGGVQLQIDIPAADTGKFPPYRPRREAQCAAGLSEYRVLISTTRQQVWKAR